MSHLRTFLYFAAGLYLAECFLWTGTGGLLLLSWGRRFRAVRGPAVRFRSPWPGGAAFSFPLRDPEGCAKLPLEGAEERWGLYQKAARIPNLLGRALLSTALAALLLYLSRMGRPLFWAALGSLFLVLHFSIAPFFWRAYRNLHPDRKFGRIKGLLLCLLSPWQSVRSSDLLAEGLLEGFHPLSAARLLLDRESFLPIARKFLLELRYPEALRGGSPKVPKGEDERLTQWLKEQGEDPEVLLAPPRPSNPSSKSYCRRCDLEYSIPQGRCGDCGRDLTPFPG